MKNFLYITLICFLAFSCKKKDTSWTTDWGAPIVSDTLTLSNFMNDSTLTTSNQATIDVDLTRTLLDIGIKDIIKIPDTTISQFFSPLLNINNVQPGFTFVNSIEEHTFDLNGIELKKIRTAKGLPLKQTQMDQSFQLIRNMILNLMEPFTIWKSTMLKDTLEIKLFRTHQPFKFLILIMS
jgi:hypothetical protein